MVLDCSVYQVTITVEVRGKAGTYLQQTISLDQLEKVSEIFDPRSVLST